MANPDQPTQADLFGATQKKTQARQAIAAKNKADREAGIQPLQEPLAAAAEEEDGAAG